MTDKILRAQRKLMCSINTHTQVLHFVLYFIYFLSYSTFYLSQIHNNTAFVISVFTKKMENTA